MRGDGTGPADEAAPVGRTPRAGLTRADDETLEQELVTVVQRLSLAHDLPAVQEIVRVSARRLAGADGATFVLREGDECHYVDEDAVAPLWKGRRFPLDSCISGWVMTHRQAVAIPDITVDARIPQEAYRPTFVRSLAMVPIRALDPIGAIGVYWAREHEPDARQLRLLQALADSTAVAMDSVRAFADLEQRVAARTAELSSAIDRLEREIGERRRAEARVRELSRTDELTGLLNRRGFLHGARAARNRAPRDASGRLLFVDIDGLKAVNDRLGHARGDDLLRAAAEVLLGCFRADDLVARIGGDEFAVFVPESHDQGADLGSRIEAAAAARSQRGDLPAPLRVSVGITRVDGDHDRLEALLARADQAMYAHKRSRRRGDDGPLGGRSDVRPALG